MCGECGSGGGGRGGSVTLRQCVFSESVVVAVAKVVSK